MRNLQNGRNLQGAWAARIFLRLCLALASVFACFIGFSSANVVKLRVDGEREFYLYSASSQAVIRSRLDFFDLPFLKGECVTVKTDVGKSINDRLLRAREEVEKFGGVIVLEENVGGMYSLYCYFPKSSGLYDGVFVGGEKGGVVNLHIAVSPSRTVVGSPIIFGGY